MKNLFKLFAFLTIVVFLILSAGCTTRIPTGFIGMIEKPSGLTGEVIAPGRRFVGPRSKLVLIESSERVTTETMKILCADELNFGFDLKIRGQVSSTDGKTVKNVLNNIGSQAKKQDAATFIVPYQALYVTYVQPSARAISRGVVGKYQTTQVRENREAIDKEIYEKLKQALSGTPVTLTLVASSNYDYPKIITEAMEARKQREVQIKQEEANQAVELLKIRNRKKLAVENIAARAAEAKAEAVFMRTIGSAASSNYLRLREIEAALKLYGRVGPGDKVILQTSAHPLIQIGK